MDNIWICEHEALVSFCTLLHYAPKIKYLFQLAIASNK